MDNGLWTEKFSDEPISGKVYDYFGEKSNPKKVYMGNMVNGKKEGNWKSYYHITGKKKYDENYKDGKLGELRTEWYDNGNIKSITSHKETRNRIVKVKYIEYYENGKIDWYSPGDFNGNLLLKNSNKKIIVYMMIRRGRRGKITPLSGVIDYSVRCSRVWRNNLLL